MWTDVYLRLPDEEAWLAADLINGETLAIDVIGVESGAHNEPKDGFLVNLRIREGESIPDNIAAFIIEKPEVPVRVFMDVTQ